MESLVLRGNELFLFRIGLRIPHLRIVLAIMFYILLIYCRNVLLLSEIGSNYT